MVYRTYAEPQTQLHQEYNRKRKILSDIDPEIQHAKGKLTARERIDYFFDPQTFSEIGLYVTNRPANFGMAGRQIPADGVVTGYGKVSGRMVMAAAQDYTAMAGTCGENHGKKIARAVDLAREMGIPFVSMNDSAGARIQEGTDAHRAYGALLHSHIIASGIVPRIALLMGYTLGGQAYQSVVQDIVIQCKHTGFMAAAGPTVIRTLTSEDIDIHELAGWKAHAIKSGQTHLVAEDDREAMDTAREVLALLPSNNREKPPRIPCQDDPERTIPDLESVVPAEPFKPFDMHEIICRITDNGYFLETLKYHAPNLISGFARFNGRTTGIVANQPMHSAGCLDINAADKAARFVRLCDLFNIPIVTLHDCPGYIIGSDQDWRGILRHGAKLLYAWGDATVPLVSIIIRKSFGGAHYGMLDKSIGADMSFAWPTAKIALVGAETAADIIFAREIKDSPNPTETRNRRIMEYRETFENPYRSAERGDTDDIINPADTRRTINGALDLLANKTVTRPWKKYSNMTL